MHVRSAGGWKLCIPLLVLGLLATGLVSAEEEPRSAARLGFREGSPAKRVVDPMTWDKGEECRWAFQHISEIIPTANITRGSGAPRPLTSTPIDLSGVTFATADGAKTTIRTMLRDTYTDGFIVLQNGRVLYEKYFNGMKPHTRHLLMSASKSVTGTLAGILVEDGRLNPDKLVVDYIPELRASPGFAEATVRHILDMTTSIVFSEDYDDPKAEVVAHEQASGWRGRSPIANKGLYAFAKTIKKDEREHGKLFHYASINTDVLGWLIERASGQRLIHFMEEALWSKLGADHDAQLSVDYLGSPVVNGGFCMTLRDLARFAQMVLDDGRAHGTQIVSSGWIDDIQHGGNNAAWSPKYAKLWPKGFYRNQWYVTKDDHGSFFAVGVNGQHIWINPTARVVIVKLSSYPVSAHVESAQLTWRGMDALARHLLKR